LIYLVRHGEAAAGWGHAADPGLSGLGHKQARAVAEVLAIHDISQIFASPMARCQETALPFSQRTGLDIVTEPDVTEIPTPDGLDDRVAWLRGFMASEWDAALPLISGWKDRLLARLSALPDNSVVFTHFIAINTIVGHLEGSNLVTSFRPGHCSVTQLASKDGTCTVAERGSEAATQVL